MSGSESNTVETATELSQGVGVVGTEATVVDTEDVAIDTTQVTEGEGEGEGEGERDTKDEAKPSVKELFTVPSFLPFLLGDIVNQTGDSLFFIALPWLVLQ
ncbi:hypothetical protein KIPB_008974, partial [Kipferlia bialata]|eukprot:g8974.t1